MKEVILDTETTGLSIHDGHRIVEIGCIELNDLIPTQNKFHCYLNPERKVSEKALEVHGYTDEFLSTQKKFSEVVDEFLNFIENKLNQKGDIIIFIQSKKTEVTKRLKKRNNFNLDLLNKFKKVQLSLIYKKKKSHFIIKNNFNNKSVKIRVKKILKKIL